MRVSLALTPQKRGRAIRRCQDVIVIYVKGKKQYDLNTDFIISAIDLLVAGELTPTALIDAQYL